MACTRLALLVLIFGAAACHGSERETNLAPEERAKLDTFEGVAIDKADKVFSSRDWGRAAVEYEAFLVQFPESRVVAYALLQKARSLQWKEKRFEAIKAYQEVLDFFPDDVRHAAAALYRIGECHMQSGDVEKAMKSWKQMADDPDYARQPLAASALNQLAENLVKQDKWADAIARYEQVAVAFRAANPDAARQAIERVVPSHVRRKPDLAALRRFYVSVGGFGPNPLKPDRVPAEEASDAEFWEQVRAAIKRNEGFTDVQRDERTAYYRYWADRMAGRFPADDEFQLDVANFIRASDQDEAAWIRRLDEQFAARQKAGDYDRVVRWIAAFGDQKAKVEEYYGKLDFSKMSNAAIASLMKTLFLSNREPARAAAVFDKLRLAEMTDADKEELVRWFQQHPGPPVTRDLAIRTCQSLSDPAAGKMAAVRYCHWRCQQRHLRRPDDFQDGLRFAAELDSDPRFAKQAHSLRGNMLQWSDKFEDAIHAYRDADEPPQTLFWTAECLQSLGRLEPAVAQLKEIESFFKDRAAEACLRIAYLYRDAGVKDKYVQTLRGVLKKYPKSGQSSEAHQRLEEMGLRIGGGVDADDS